MATAPSLLEPIEAQTELEQARKLSERDPDAAWKWAFSQPSGDTRDKLLDDLIYTVGAHDPAWAWERALSLPQSGHRVNLLGRCLETQAESDLDTAKAWLSSFPPGKEHDQLLVSLLNSIEDVEEALTLIEDTSSTSLRSLPGTSAVNYSTTSYQSMKFLEFYQVRLLERANDLVRTLGIEKPRAALAWLGRLGLPFSKYEARELIEQWHHHSPEETQAWIDRAPTEIARFIPEALLAHHEE